MAKSFKIGNAVDTVLDVASNIASKAKNVDYNGIYTDIRQAIKQTDEELAEVAKASLMKQMTGDLKVPPSMLQEVAQKTGVNDPGFTRAVNNLSVAMKKKDLSEAHRIASAIDMQYQPGQKTFQDLVIQADIELKNSMSIIEGLNPKETASIWKDQFADKLPNQVKNFTTPNDRQKIAELGYRIQGAKKYFATDDPSINKKRLGTVAGGYMAVTSGMRIINGGTPLTNEYGERDIAGIPFI